MTKIIKIRTNESGDENPFLGVIFILDHEYEWHFMEKCHKKKLVISVKVVFEVIRPQIGGILGHLRSKSEHFQNRLYTKIGLVIEKKWISGSSENI